MRGYVYDMDEYVGKNIDRYLKDTGAKKKLKKVATPFLDESREPMGCTVAEAPGNGRSQKKIDTFPTAEAYREFERSHGC